MVETLLLCTSCSEEKRSSDFNHTGKGRWRVCISCNHLQSEGFLFCRKCKVKKPLEDFYKNSPTKRGYSSYCKACSDKRCLQWQKDNPEKAKSRARRWRRDNREKAKAQQLRHTYKIDMPEYEQLLKHQGGVCAICGGTQDKSKEYLCVDHSHITGNVRGLLCHRCNFGISQFVDNPELMEKAARYIRERGR